jgi:hypothetical protein
MRCAAIRFRCEGYLVGCRISKSPVSQRCRLSTNPICFARRLSRRLSKASISTSCGAGGAKVLRGLVARYSQSRSAFSGVACGWATLRTWSIRSSGSPASSKRRGMERTKTGPCFVSIRPVRGRVGPGSSGTIAVTPEESSGTRRVSSPSTQACHEGRRCVTQKVGGS